MTLTFTIPALAIFIFVLAVAVGALLFGGKMGALRYVIAGIGFLFAAYMIRGWAIGGIVLAVIGALCILGSIDAVRGKRGK